MAELSNIDQKINFEGNVIIKQNKSFLKGNSAVIDFKKGLSSISSNEQNSVTGVFYQRTLNKIIDLNDGN